MPRTARATVGGLCYHVINRGNRRAEVFHNEADYEQFVRLMHKSTGRVPIRVLAYCLMPNHFHLVVWPHHDGDLSRWMHWLLTTHVSRYRWLYESTGRVWQGRFKSFPIQEDGHLLSVLRYVERNPLRANLVDSAGDWRWSSLGPQISGANSIEIDNGPVSKPGDWPGFVDEPQNTDELKALRKCMFKNAPFGDSKWTKTTALQLGLESSLRSPGRPRKSVRGKNGDIPD